MTANPPQFQLISTLRYDPILPEIVSRYPTISYPDTLRTPYYLLPYHLDRLVSAARHFQWHHEALHRFQTDPDAFLTFLDGFVPDRTKPWRLRIVVEEKEEEEEDKVKVEAYPTAPVETPRLLVWPFGRDSGARDEGGPVWRVYVDKEPMEPSGFTKHKTTAREGYTAARARAGITSPQDHAEVLVVNPDDEVMEGSITTPYFWRPSAAGDGHGEWVTPPLSCGGNAGTTRRYALVQGFCSERIVPVADLVDGEECWISNGVRGFMRGVLCR